MSMFIKQMRARFVIALALAAGLGAAAMMAGAQSANPPVRLAKMDQSLEGLRSLSDAFVSVADRVLPAVVYIYVRAYAEQEQQPQLRQRRSPMEDFPFRDFFGDDIERFFEFRQRQPRDQQGVGSGVIVDAKNGYILTNNHVVGEADEIEVHLHDKRVFDAKLIGADKTSDIAVVQISADNLTAAPIGRSEDLKVGEIVMAIGSPLGLASSVTQGIVSAKGRQAGILGQAGIESFIQTDAAVNVGNSGGPLVNLEGEVVGINTAIASATGMFAGVSFAVPIDMAKRIMGDLVQHGKVSYGYLGVTVGSLEPSMAKNLGLSGPEGVLVNEVRQGTPAAKAGLKDLDVILKLDGETVKDSNWFVGRISARRPGDSVKMEVMRGGQILDVTVKLGERPAMDELAGGSPGSAPQRSRGGQAQDEGKELKSIGLTVRTLTEDVAKRIGAGDRKGVVVTNVEPRGAADRKGIRNGLVITRVKNQAVETAEQFEELVAQELKERGSVILRVFDGDSEFFVLLEPKA